MDLFEKRETPVKTVKTKSGKDINEEKYKTMLTNLELARQAKRNKKAGDVPPTPSTSPAQAPAPVQAQPAKAELTQLDRALMLISLQDRKIKELTAKPAVVEQPKVEPPKPSEPIDIPKPFIRHWSLLE